jgi:hypothetical protein
MRDPHKPLVISCSILRDEIEALVASGDLDIETRYIGARLHYDYGRLQTAITASLQKAPRDRHPRGVLVYGDVCLGFQEQIKPLVAEHGFVKVDALNCVDCLLGGKGQLLKVDPDHKSFFLTPGWIRFWNAFEQEKGGDLHDRYRMLDGLVLLDSLGNLNELSRDIEKISRRTGLPVKQRRAVGLDGLRRVIAEALERIGPV